jgi:hypothetical protein
VDCSRLCTNVRRAAEHVKGIYTGLRLLREQPLTPSSLVGSPGDWKVTEEQPSHASGYCRKYFERVPHRAGSGG